jgi:hypothetical protein
VDTVHVTHNARGSGLSQNTGYECSVIPKTNFCAFPKT